MTAKAGGVASPVSGHRTRRDGRTDGSVSELARYSAEAYLSGWALTAGPWTPRVEAGCAAAVATALEFRDDPAVLEAALQLGQVEGVQALVDRRRLRLLARCQRAAAAAWDEAMAGLDARTAVRRFRQQVYLHGQPSETTKDPARKWWQDVAAGVAVGWLYSLYHAKGYPALVAAVEDAIRQGMAEGEAAALALAAARQGVPGFQVDRAFKAAYGRLAADHSVSQRAAATVARIIDGAAYDVSRRLAAMAGDDAAEDDMTQAVEQMTAGDDCRSLDTYLGDAIWAAAGAAAVALAWQAGDGEPGAPPPEEPPEDTGDLGGTPRGGGPVSPGMIMISWQTGGPNPCVGCEENQSNSPYAPQDVPQFPGHPACRCALSLAGDVPSSLFAAYLLS